MDPSNDKRTYAPRRRSDNNNELLILLDERIANLHDLLNERTEMLKDNMENIVLILNEKFTTQSIQIQNIITLQNNRPCLTHDLRIKEIETENKRLRDKPDAPCGTHEVRIKYLEKLTWTFGIGTILLVIKFLISIIASYVAGHKITI